MNIFCRLLPLLCGVVPFSLYAQAPTPKPGLGSQTPKVAPAKPTGFTEVAPYLSADGSSLDFLNTQDFVSGLEAILEAVSKAILAEKPNDPEAKLGVKAIQLLYSKSGISTLAALGSSSVQREPGLYFNRSYFRRTPGKNEPGFLWNTFSGNQLDSLNLLPATTAFATFGNVDFAWLETTITQVAADLGKPVNIQEQLAPMGLDWKQLSGSLDNGMGIVISLDPASTINLPIEGKSFTIPKPSLAIIIRTKNDTIFQTALKLAGGKMQPQTEAGVTFVSSPVPNPVMEDLAPTLAVVDNYLIIASHRELPLQMAALLKGKSPGLLKTPEFQSLSRDVPMEGSTFSFMGSQMTKTFDDLFTNIVTEASKSGQEMPKQFLDFAKGLFIPRPFFGVVQRNNADWLMTSNGPQVSTASISSTPATVAMLSAIAVPNFLRARQRSQATRVLEDARMLDAAIDQLAIENNLKGTTEVTFEQLTAYLKPDSKLVQSGGKDLLGNPFIFTTVDDSVQVNPLTIEKLKDVAPPAFWGEYVK